MGRQKLVFLPVPAVTLSPTGMKVFTALINPSHLQEVLLREKRFFQSDGGVELAFNKSFWSLGFPSCKTK